MPAIKFSKVDFTEKVLKSDKPVLVDLWAEWCGPCRMVGPVIDELADQYAGKVIIGKINVDEAPELATQYNIMSVPTVIMFKAGKEVERQVGFVGKEQYEEMMKKVIK